MMDRTKAPFYVPVLFAFATVIVALFLAPSRVLSVFCNSAQRLHNIPPKQRPISTAMSTKKTPVYFLSHGGPNIIYDISHPVYPKLQEIGKEITHKVKPKAVVVFSAHWQGKPDVIEVNTAESTDLIYDFYGFPANYYEEKFPNKGSKEVANKVISLLANAGIKTRAAKRGLDHGVWASFRVAFNPETNPLTVPIVQASLFDTEDPDQHYALGRAVAALRSENIQVLVSGMAVHNLRDFQSGMGNAKPLPYATSFDEALREAVTTNPEERQRKMRELLWRKDARQAHPTFDHLLPIFVGAGAAEKEKGVRLWTLAEGSMSWAQYRFGELAEAT